MNLLVTGAFNCDKNDLHILSNMGHSVVFHQMESDELPCAYDWVEGLICNCLFLYHAIEKFHNLKYIQLTSAGYDRVDVNYVQEHNIKIFNARGVYSIPMAEFVLCSVLNLYKQSRFFTDNQKIHNWNKHRGLLDLYGKTVCILGCGNVGTECAKRFKAFGTTIYGVDIIKPHSELFDEYFTIDNVSDAINDADIIVLTLPLTKQTRYMFDKNMFKLLKSTAILVNISRGAVINECDLIDALRQEKLHGAILDVFENEPLSNESPLWDLPNVLITPHNSFVSENNIARLSEVIFNNLKMEGKQ